MTDDSHVTMVSVNVGGAVTRMRAYGMGIAGSERTEGFDRPARDTSDNDPRLFY